MPENRRFRPWAEAITTAWQRIQAIPQAP